MSQCPRWQKHISPIPTLCFLSNAKFHPCPTLNICNWEPHYLCFVHETKNCTSGHTKHPAAQFKIYVSVMILEMARPLYDVSCLLQRASTGGRAKVFLNFTCFTCVMVLHKTAKKDLMTLLHCLYPNRFSSNPLPHTFSRGFPELRTGNHTLSKLTLFTSPRRWSERRLLQRTALPTSPSPGPPYTWREEGAARQLHTGHPAEPNVSATVFFRFGHNPSACATRTQARNYETAKS